MNHELTAAALVDFHSKFLLEISSKVISADMRALLLRG